MKASVKSTRHGLSLSALRAVGTVERARLGCTDTLREIMQQPQTWRTTATMLHAAVSQRAFALQPKPACVVLTGSGSSLYVGECLAPSLQSLLGVPCLAIAAGTLMAEPGQLPPLGKGLLVSIARSGDSPESTGAVDAVLSAASDWRHLVVTCNAIGALTTRYTSDPRVQVLLLDPATNDRSLVMTSSFTNMVLAAGGVLGIAASPGVAAVAENLLRQQGDGLAAWAAQDMDAVVCVGDGASVGATHEAALKLLEMSAGAVRVMTETSLGLRHGPMAWLNRPSQMLVFMSSDPVVRGYQTDLLKELSRKRLGVKRIVVGDGLDSIVVGSEGVAVDLPGLYGLPAPQQAMVHVVVGQLLALFRCLALGQKPDAPSQGVLTRVVQAFPVHARRSV